VVSEKWALCSYGLLFNLVVTVYLVMFEIPRFVGSGRIVSKSVDSVYPTHKRGDYS
jgi:hypothetical protein